MFLSKYSVRFPKLVQPLIIRSEADIGIKTFSALAGGLAFEALNKKYPLEIFNFMSDANYNSAICIFLFGPLIKWSQETDKTFPRNSSSPSSP